VPDKVDLVLYQQGILARQDAYVLSFDDPAANRSRRFCTITRIWSWRWRASLRHFASRWWSASSKPCRGRMRCSRGHGAAQPGSEPRRTPLGVRRIRLRHGIPDGQPGAHGVSDCRGVRQRSGVFERAAEILSIVGGAFGWRALARELAGKIPFGGGIIPKGAIAYAGTYVVGKGLSITTTPARPTRARNARKCTTRPWSAGRRSRNPSRQAVNAFPLPRVVQYGKKIPIKGELCV